jgi:amino acid transporter
MVVTLSACGSKSLLRWLLLAIWAIAEALYLRVVLILGPGDHHLDVAITGIFFLLVMVVCVAAILPYIFQKRQVSVDTIFAAVVAYFFISFIFANLSSLIYFILSFNLPPTPSPNQFYAVFTQMLYFNLVTIVGVGYGDILPLLPFPRMVAAVQGVLRHFYVAVLVAWLVGTFISQSIQLSQKQEERTLERLLE